MRRPEDRLPKFFVLAGTRGRLPSTAQHTPPSESVALQMEVRIYLQLDQSHSQIFEKVAGLEVWIPSWRDCFLMGKETEVLVVP